MCCEVLLVEHKSPGNTVGWRSGQWLLSPKLEKAQLSALPSRPPLLWAAPGPVWGGGAPGLSPAPPTLGGTRTDLAGSEAVVVSQNWW